MHGLKLALQALLAVGAVAVAAAAAVEVVEMPVEEQRSDVSPAEGVLAGLPKMSCSTSTKNKAFINRCMRNNFQALLPAIRNGGVLGLPSVEPYDVENVVLNIKTLPISFRVVFSNLSVHGLTNSTIRDVRSNLREDGLNMDIDLTIPKLTFKGLFEFSDGVFATWTFKGRGPFEINIFNIRATWKMSGKKRAEDTHMTIEHLTPLLSYTVGGLKFWAKGLVDGSPGLDDVVNLMVNRLWSDVVDLGKPFFNKPIAEHLTILANDVFRSVPYKTLFPTSPEPADAPSSS